MKKEEEAGKAVRIFGLAIAVLVFDQLSKFIVAKYVDKSIPVISSFFNIVNIHNTGAGFGMLAGQNTVLIFISAIVFGAILFGYGRLPNSKMAACSIGLILGGIVGNLIDRIRLGYVVDFLDFSIWPSFNIADSAITIGAILLIIYTWRKESGQKK